MLLTISCERDLLIVVVVDKISRDNHTGRPRYAALYFTLRYFYAISRVLNLIRLAEKRAVRSGNDASDYLVKRR